MTRVWLASTRTNKDKDPTLKDKDQTFKDKDKDLKMILKKSLRTRINIPVSQIHLSVVYIMNVITLLLSYTVYSERVFYHACILLYAVYSVSIM